jgi:hypothetical protein
MSGHRVFINLPWELAEKIGHHFESCRRIAATSTMAVFVLPKCAKFNDLTRHWKLYQEFPTRTQMFTRQSLDDPTQQEVLALAPLHVQLWLVDSDFPSFYDQVPTTTHDEPTRYVYLMKTLAMLQQFSSKSAVVFPDLTEARPLIRNEQTMKNPHGGHLISGLVDCAATLDFVSEDFVRRFTLRIRESPTKTPYRLAKGKRVTSSTVCDITIELARHEFQRTFYVLRDLRVADLVLGLT